MLCAGLSFALVTLPVSFKEEGSASTDIFEAPTHCMTWPCSHVARAEGSVRLNGEQGKPRTGRRALSSKVLSAHSPAGRTGKGQDNSRVEKVFQVWFLIIFG